MSRQANRSRWLGIVANLGWPVIIGSALSSVFLALVMRGPLRSDLSVRYFAGHPVNMCEVVLFFVGLAALFLKFSDVIYQSLTLRRIGLSPGAGDTGGNDCQQLLTQLAQLPSSLQGSYLAQRLRAALQYVARSRRVAGLSDELKYLSDVAISAQQESFGLVRIIIWATPMLGFLGTVVGITQALGDLDPQLLATDPKTAMQGLLAGLYVAFDTTAEALSLSMVLMFIQFFADRIETQLLSAVDQRAEEELLGRFADEVTDANPHVAAVQRMSSTVLKATQQLVQDQTDHWKQTIDRANSQWQQLFETSARGMQSALTTSLDSSLQSFTDRMLTAERETEERLQGRWEQWQKALSDNARLLHSQQTELVRQGEVMTRALEATGEVIKLEDVLNGNLRALAGARHFEDTVMSLAAAIHLLNARLGENTYGPDPVVLSKPVKQGRAA